MWTINASRVLHIGSAWPIDSTCQIWVSFMCDNPEDFHVHNRCCLGSYTRPIGIASWFYVGLFEVTIQTQRTSPEESYSCITNNLRMRLTLTLQHEPDKWRTISSVTWPTDCYVSWKISGAAKYIRKPPARSTISRFPVQGPCFASYVSHDSTDSTVFWDNGDEKCTCISCSRRIPSFALTEPPTSSELQ